MIQTTGLTGHMSFPSFTASVTLQKRPGSNVSVEKPPAFKYLFFLSIFANALYQLVNALDRVLNLLIARSY